MNRFIPLIITIIGISHMLSSEETINPELELLSKAGGIEEYELKSNGLKVLLYPNDAMPVATVMLTYKVGSRNEVNGVTGATHILEHMMFKGSKSFPRSNNMDYSSQMERIGARSNATTSYDRTNYYATLPKNQVALAIELEADRLRGLQLKKSDLDSEMVVVKNEYELRENNPYETLFKKIFETAFEVHPYHHPIIGWESDIEAITVEKLKVFYNTYYWPNNAVLSVIGGFDRASTLKAIKEYFGPIPRSPEPIPQLNVIEPKQEAARHVDVRRAGKVGAVMVTHKIPHGTHSDWADILLISELLSADKVGRLYRVLDDKGLASTSFVFPRRLKDPSLIILGAALTETSSHESIQAIILNEINILIDKGVSKNELDRARSVLLNDKIYAQDGSYSIADDLNDAIAIGDWKDYLELSKSLKSVTVESIQEVARKYFIEATRTTGWFIPTTSTTAVSGNEISALDPYYYKAPESNNQTQENADRPEVEFTPFIKSFTLSGVDVTTIKIPVPGVVSFVGSIAAGDFQSPDVSPLLADITAEMLDKGTLNKNRFEISELLDASGMKLKFASNIHALEFKGKFLKKDSEALISILAEQLKTPLFDPEVLSNLKEQYKSYLLQYENDTDYMSESLLSESLYPKIHPNHALGLDKLRASLEAIEVADIVEFHKEHYGKQSLKLVFSGDIDYRSLRKGIKKSFGKWDAGAAYKEVPKDNSASLKSDTIIRHFIPDKSSVSVKMGCQTSLKRSDPDYIPFSVANYILGGTGNARLMQSVRKEKGLTYGVYSYHTGDIKTTGHWALQASFSPDLLDKGMRAINEVLVEWHTNGVSEKEVHDAIETLKGRYVVGLSNTGAVAEQIHSFLQRGFPPLYIDVYPQALDALTPDRVNQAIKKYFDPSLITTVQSGSLNNLEAHKAKKPITLSFEVPDPSWKVQISQVFESKDTLIVIAHLDNLNTVNPQVITRISDTVYLDSAKNKKPVRFYILGKKWNWIPEIQNAQFIKDLTEIQSALDKASALNFNR